MFTRNAFIFITLLYIKCRCLIRLLGLNLLRLRDYVNYRIEGIVVRFVTATGTGSGFDDTELLLMGR